MRHSERIRVCRSCKNRSFHRDLGTICSLTLESPKFSVHCPDYDVDTRLLKSIQEKEDALLDRKKGVWRDLGYAFLGLLLLILGGISFRGTFIQKGGDLIRRTMK